MSSSQPPDERRNNKRQMSLNTSMQIPGIIQPSGTIVNKRPRPELSTLNRNTAIANAPGDLVARLVELGQQVADLGLPIFSSVIITVVDAVSTIEEEKDHEIMIEEICDLCDQIAVRLIQPLKEGKVTGIIENMIQSLMGGLQAIVGEYNHMTAEARHYPHLLDNISTKFLESLSCTLRESVNISELAISNEHTDALDVVQRINARTITIEQMVSSTERMFREYTSNNQLTHGTDGTAITLSRDKSLDQDDLGRMGGRALNAAEEATLNAIQPRADNAKYDSQSQTSSSFCLENTRVALLEEIFSWVNDPHDRPIFWLSGMAGTGKSTIARTVAKGLDDKGLLGASFFFSRDEEDRRSTARLFPTIAYQLARSMPSLREHIIAAANPDVCKSMMQKQIDKLIVGPLKVIPDVTSPIVIILDALDECEDENHVIELLVLLSSAVQKLRSDVNLKVMVTGRPEMHIQGEFKRPGMDAVLSISHLHDIDKSIVSDDILRYLNHHLVEIRNKVLSPNTNWPQQSDVNALVQMADGLFIFASVAVKYIKAQPLVRMETLLSGAGHRKAKYTFKHLDILYKQVLGSSTSNDDDPEEVEELNVVLGTIVVALDPLSTRTLELLLELKSDTVKPRLKPFYSLLSIQDPPYPIHVFHKSFPDFLMDEQRSGSESWYYIDAKRHHTRLTLLCLKHMNMLLKRDMLNMGNTLNSEVDNRVNVLNKWVPPHLLYACHQWASHLVHADHSKKLGDELNQFCTTKILYWLEILSFTNKLSEGVHLLTKATKWSQLHNLSSTSLLNDCYQFLHYFHEAISQGPCHIYQSALPFIPECDLLSVMQRELTEVVKVITGKIESKPFPWLVNHRRDSGYQLVDSIAISHDGTQTVSGFDDGTVAIWDAQTGNLLRKIEGHINRVRSVAFSPDGIQIASGSSDRTVAIWDAQTGSLFRKLDGHRGGVNSVAFSPDGAQVASGSSDRTVAIWDVQTGNLLRKLGHTNWVESAFSPEGTQVASQAGSDNRTAAIWNAQRPQRGYPQSLQIDTNWVTSVAFSPDGTQIASSFFDGSVTIWDAQTGKLLRTIKGHTNWLNAFSLDGYRVQSTDNPNIALFWELEMLQEVESSSAYMFSKSVLSDHHWFLDGRWIMRIFHQKTQYVCFLMYNDITAHAFYKSSCILGTRSGHIYILDLSACRYPE